MTQPLIRQVAGVYAEEVAQELGLLLLQSSVLAGLSVEDGVRYIPDSFLVPQNPESHNDKLIDVLYECRELVSLTVATSASRLGLLPIEAPECFVELPALSLARMAQTLRPSCLSAAFTVAANEIRTGNFSLAEKTLLRASEFLVTPAERSRWLRNRAASRDCGGDGAGALRFAAEAIRVNPGDTHARHDHRAYLERYTALREHPLSSIPDSELLYPPTES